jgi:hypothetical protein
MFIACGAKRDDVEICEETAMAWGLRFENRGLQAIIPGWRFYATRFEISTNGAVRRSSAKAGMSIAEKASA